MEIWLATLDDAEGLALVHFRSHTESFREFSSGDWMDKLSLAANIKARAHH